jgi:hypothetical protein
MEYSKMIRNHGGQIYEIEKSQASKAREKIFREKRSLQKDY